jgi:signal transduction histidine kinase
VALVRTDEAPGPIGRGPGTSETTTPRLVTVLSDQSTTADARGRVSARLLLHATLLTCLLVLAALTSQGDDWQPLSLVIALGTLMIFVETISTWARKLRLSSGLMVQATIMALLGPAPAVVIGMLAMAIDGRVNRRPLEGTLLNMNIFGLLGLVGGLAMGALGTAFGLDREDTAYALLVVPVYLGLMTANLALVAATAPGLAPDARRRVFREIGAPTIPLELLSGILAAAAVLTWAHVGLGAVIGLLVVLVITIPLARALGSGLKTGDDLAALRQVSDQRAAEVTRLSLDRERLLSEVVEAEQRERARLAESLHDGPVQRLVAIRQDLAEGAVADQLARHVDATLAETRAIISAFHPVMVRELGFEASLRAAIAPFPAGRSVALTVTTLVDDRWLAGSVLLPVAQELVVNAVKHAGPSAIDVSVRPHDGHIVLEVNDDGIGIDTSDAGRAVQAGHLGLAMVRRRVEDAGGQFEIETRADGGTPRASACHFADGISRSARAACPRRLPLRGRRPQASRRGCGGGS